MPRLASVYWHTSIGEDYLYIILVNLSSKYKQQSKSFGPPKQPSQKAKNCLVSLYLEFLFANKFPQLHQSLHLWIHVQTLQGKSAVSTLVCAVLVSSGDFGVHRVK